jgi:hypothetical protein
MAALRITYLGSTSSRKGRGDGLATVLTDSASSPRRLREVVSSLPPQRALARTRALENAPRRPRAPSDIEPSERGTRRGNCMHSSPIAHLSRLSNLR